MASKKTTDKQENPETTPTVCAACNGAALINEGKDYCPRCQGTALEPVTE